MAEGILVSTKVCIDRMCKNHPHLKINCKNKGSSEGIEVQPATLKVNRCLESFLLPKSISPPLLSAPGSAPVSFGPSSRPPRLPD